MMKKLLCTLFLAVFFVGFVNAQADINVQGNGNDILDGSVEADVTPTNFTDFGDVVVNSGSVSRTFFIQNSGSEFIFGGAPTVSGAGFSVDLTNFPGGFWSLPANGNQVSFDVSFNPTAVGEFFATVSIGNNVPGKNPYDFVIRVNVTPDPSSQLLITQYYEGLGANDKWIEIKNISETSAGGGTPNRYFLALYQDSEGTISGGIESQPPSISIEIDELAPGEVVLYSMTGASVPGAANRNPAATVVPTSVCNFDGNDIILISTADDETAYSSRIDIVGVVGTNNPVTWGQDVALIKGCGTQESPSINYTGDYIAFTNNTSDPNQLSDVNNANPNTNLALGTQLTGGFSWNGTSWEDAGSVIPDKTTNVTINGTYIAANGSFEACNLTIGSGQNLNFDSGTTNFVKVNKDLIVNGTFTIGDTESLITTDVGANLGTITKKETTTTLKQYDFTYWCSPVQGAATSVFTNSGAPAERIFRWYKPIGGGDYGGWEQYNGTMEVARGYISEGPDGATSHTVDFVGVPNNGQKFIDVKVDITIPSNGGGFNLIGNPYPSAIDIDEFITYPNNSGVTTGTIWLWTHNTAYQENPGTDADYVVEDYVTYNLSGANPIGSVTKNIGSGQGFFVNALLNEQVFFTNSMRLENENNQFFKQPNTKTSVVKDRMWLDLKSKQGGAFDQILVGFFDGATDGEDSGYDGHEFSAGNYISFYSTIENEKFSIQGLGSFSSDKQVSIGFDAWVKETFTISINTLEGILENEEIYLVDNYLNIVHDLKASDYEFEVTETGSFSDRFTLQFNKSVLSVGNENLDNTFIVVNENETLRVRAGNAVENIKVYDMLGRLLIDTNPKELDFTLNTSSIAKGTVLVLNATLENGAQVSKKAIKY